IPQNYKVLFLQGGATLQFAQVPMNLLSGRGKADYVVTGEWSKKAVKEASALCDVAIAATSEDRSFNYAPPQAVWKLRSDAAYVHYCSNETIGGVEFHWIPDTGAVPLVADSVAAARRIQVRADLRRGAEEHRPRRARDRSCPRRPARQGSEGNAYSD